MMIFINQLIFEGINFTDHTIIINHFANSSTINYGIQPGHIIMGFSANGDPGKNMGIQTPIRAA